MSDFVSGLVADAPDPSLAAELDLFGRFVGSWRVQNRYRSSLDEEWTSAARTWIFSWVLGGRAIQDVIIGSDRGDDQVAAGTTVRAYDPRIGAWRVNWFGTLHANYGALIARAHGGDGIRQDGVDFRADRDVPIRWNFSDITADSFTWDGWSSADGGETWWLEQHMEAVRQS
ncbi:hypothetical protein G5T42_06680 [Microbacterium sp. 4R-513]|uniref:hypothetical protein n=1 Tax=Microbacterium sp. 4R-513 TaxID=2567934 RepID=UPI0013E14D1A|nr:hypothetical protein [Microbacterium sp. 4R-513]QIG39209.1 hypothetical protein G5T42_06680 [Microbacterium sp. 4R-513]